MKKGINSIDAFLAIVAMLFIMSWMQSFVEMSLSNAQEFGLASSAKTKAIETGSVMNSFFAANPAPGDYLLLNDTLKIFNGELALSITKEAGKPNVTIGVYYGAWFNSSYPVVSRINYDASSGKVTA